MNLYTTLASTLVATYTLIVVGVPTGCTLIGTTGPDEGFPVAHCSDNSYKYMDMDGSADRAPGTWVNAPYYAYEAQR